MFRVIALICALSVCGGSAVAEPLLMPADRAHRLAKSDEILLIDIRRPREWRKTGVPDGALTLTMHTSEEAFYQRVLAAVGRDKSKPVALICAAGNRSQWASNFLESKGFTRIANVAEGFFGNKSLPGWRARGLPVTKAVPD